MPASVAQKQAQLLDLESKIKANQHWLIAQCLNKCSQGIFIVEACEPISVSYANEACKQLIHFDDLELNMDRHAYNQLIKAITSSTAIVLTFAYKDHWLQINLTPIAGDNESAQMIGLVFDMTEHQNMQDTLVKSATHDYLTKLPNRSLLQDRLSQALIHAKMNNSLVAVCFVDLDHFKPVNDDLGHEAGDELLKSVADRLRVNTRDEDTVARYAGDEFVVILCNIVSQSQAIEIAERIRLAVAKTYFIQDHQIEISASIGMSFYPNDGGECSQLLRQADKSMYSAKNAGRNSLQLTARR